MNDTPNQPTPDDDDIPATEAFRRKPSDQKQDGENLDPALTPTITPEMARAAVDPAQTPTVVPQASGTPIGDSQGEDDALESLYFDAVLEFEKARDAGRPVPATDWINRWAARRSELKSRLADYLNKVGLGAQLRASAQLILPDFDHYEFRGLLGQGGMGAVFRVHDARLGRDAAIKVALPGLSSSPSSPTVSERLRDEARIMSQIDHPNIVAVFDVGRLPKGGSKSPSSTHPGSRSPSSQVPFSAETGRGEEKTDEDFFYTMRLIEGGSTLHSAVVEARKRPPEEQAAERHRHLQHVILVCRAIAFAHSKNVVHRDIKPQNIALGDFGQVYVIDWGLAKDLTRYVAHAPDAVSEPSLGFGGTPGFVAPEIAARVTTSPQTQQTFVVPKSHDGQPLTLEIERRADIYGLGATLYFVLTGSAPYGVKLFEWLKLVATQDPAPPRQKDRSIPRPLEAICLKALARDPQQRYESANELADDLERFLADKPVHAYREGFRERLARWGRTHKTLVRVATLFALVAVGVLFGYREMQQRQAQLEKEKLFAQNQARVQNYYQLVSRVAPRSQKMTTGWVEDGLKDLSQAAQLDTPVRDPVELRSQMAALLTGIELTKERTAYSESNPSGMDFLPDGQRLAISRSFGGIIRQPQIDLLNAKSGKAETSLMIPDVSGFLVKGGGSSFSDVAVSRDGRWVCGTIRDGTIHRWDMQATPPTRTMVKTVNPGKCRICISRDNRWLVSSTVIPDGGSTPSLTIVDLGNFEIVTSKTFEQLGIRQDGTTVEISPDSKVVAFTTGDYVAARELPGLESQVFRNADQGLPVFLGPEAILAIRGDRFQIKGIKTGVETSLFGPLFEMASETRGVSIARLALEGELLLAVHEGEKRLVGWETSGFKRVLNREIPSLGKGVELEVAPSGNQLALGSSYGVEFFGIQRAPVHRVIAPSEPPIRAMDISSDGRWLATLADRTEGAVTLWRLDEGDAPTYQTSWQSPFQSAQGRPSLAFSHDGKRLVHTGGSRTGQEPHMIELRQFSLPDMTELPKFLLTSDHAKNQNLAIFLNALEFGPDGHLYASAHRHLLAWDMSSSPPKEVFPPVPDRVSFADRVKAGGTMACLSVGRTLVAQCSVGFDDLSKRRVTACRISTLVGAAERQDRIELLPTDAGAVCCQLSPDERVLLIGLENGGLAVVKTPEPQILTKSQAHSEKLTAIKFLSKDLVATSSFDRTIGLWRLVGNRVELLCRLPVPGDVLNLAALPDKGLLFALVRGEYRIHRWDIKRLIERFEKNQLGFPFELSTQAGVKP